MLRTRFFALLAVVFALMLLLPPAVRADDDLDQRAIDRAGKFLDGAQRGRHILGYMHLGTKYAGHKYTETKYVTDRAGKKIPGQFALVYAYDWNDDGTTQVAFLCDRRGNIYEVQVLDSNAVINQPFALANASIKLLGSVIIEAFKDQMTAEQRKQVQKAVDDADAKRLLEMSLTLQQTFGQ
jgi:hypothetical protein